MRFCLLDTGSAGDYIRKRGHVHTKALARRLLGDRIGICIPVLGELWYGVEFSSSKIRNRVRLLGALASLKIWPYTHAAAEEYGRIFAMLRRKGRIIGRIDIQIAAIALTLGNCLVVTKDNDFRVISGLQIEDWSVP